MKKTKFLRITAFLLTLVFLFCSAATIVGAKNSSVSDENLDGIKELLNAISYGKYRETHSKVPKATEADELTLGMEEFRGDLSSDGWEIKEYDGKKGIYLPNTGEFSWSIKLPKNFHQKCLSSLEMMPKHV